MYHIFEKLVVNLGTCKERTVIEKVEMTVASTALASTSLSHRISIFFKKPKRVKVKIPFGQRKPLAVEVKIPLGRQKPHAVEAKIPLGQRKPHEVKAKIPFGQQKPLAVEVKISIDKKNLTRLNSKFLFIRKTAKKLCITKGSGEA